MRNRHTQVLIESLSSSSSYNKRRNDRWIDFVCASSAGSRSDPVRAKQWGGSPIASNLGRGGGR